MKHGVPFFPLASPCLSEMKYFVVYKNRGMEKPTISRIKKRGR